MIKKKFIYLGILGVLIIVLAVILTLRHHTRAMRSASQSIVRQSTSNTLSAPVTNTNNSGSRGTLESPQKPVESQAKRFIRATVNGEPIYMDEVKAGIEQRRFGISAEDAMRDRLDSLISIVAIRQYFKEQHIDISDEEVERQVNELRINPPAAGCACCRFKSLEEYMVAALMTMKDLRDSIRNEFGMDKCVDALWNAEFPIGEKRNSLLAENRKRIERDYMKISHIFFNTVQQPDYETNPDGVREKAKTKAMNVLQRLQKGEEFANLAKEYSEDAFSRPEGGDLGCVPKEIFGPALPKAVQQLKPGELSQPVESSWGFHIIRRETISDQDILSVLESDYKEKKAREIYDSIKWNVYVERFETETEEK